jgi:hypothetical protein
MMKGETQMSITIGEYRVGISFNPSANPDVDAIKRAAAGFIDLCAKIRAEKPDDDEINRLWALAMTHMEDAAMWAVKATTKESWDKT